ncbi:MAG: phytoene desaturase [Planctomycetota bacterium]|nr:phytoene desaturase [Planctomycetota bacterium]
MSRRVVIVGAGPGGLAAAMLLARAGARVKVLERQPRVGGRTSTFDLGGFRFDLGPTFFLYPRVLAEVFAACGRRLEDEVELVRLDPQYRIAFGQGGALDCTPRVEAMERQLQALAPADAPALRRFLADNREKLERFRPCLEQPFLGWASLLSRRLLSLLPLIRPHRSLDDELRSYFSDERIRLAFSFQSKYLGMSPFRCPSLFSILSFLEYEHGVWHPIGGCGAVTEAMARVAADLGVEVALGEEVQEVLVEGRRAVGVRTASGVERADALVINADFARAMTRLVPGHLRRAWSDEKIARARFSCSTFMLYLGVDGRFDDLPHHTIHIARDYAANLDAIERTKVLPEDPSFYVQNAGVTDPTLAPPGQSALYVLVPVPHESPHVDWTREKARYRRLVLDRLTQVGLPPDLERRIVAERVITPDDWRDAHDVHLGATFNLTHDLGQMLHLRPHNRYQDLDRVYLVGGGTHPGSGLPVIFESARISSRLLLDDLGLEVPAGFAPGPERTSFVSEGVPEGVEVTS